MKRSLPILLLMLVSGSRLLSQEFSYPDKLFPEGLTLVSAEQEQVKVNFSLASFSLATPNALSPDLRKVVMAGTFLPNDAGAPDLPGIGRYVALPRGSEPRLKVTYTQVDTLHDVVIAPAPVLPWESDDQPMVYRENPQIYSRDAFYPSEPVRISERTRIRGVDAVILGITPFQYNPVTRELIVYRDLEAEIIFEGGNGQFGEERFRSRWWDPILRDIFLNSEALYGGMQSAVSGQRSVFSGGRETGYEYLIISPNHPDFIRWADSIRVFRNMQGIYTGVVTTNETGGNNVTAIENFINYAYLTWDIPPAAILILGDYGNTPTAILAPVYNGYCVSDHIYADVDFDDEEEIILARITARNAEELEVMVRKFIDYESNPPTDPGFYQHPVTALGWQTERWFQICSEAIGGYFRNVQGKDPVRVNAVYGGNPEVDNWTTTDQNTILPVFGPEGLGYLTASPQEMGGWAGGTASQINDALNSGAFMIQHRDHGFEVGWGEPDYTVDDIDGLSNTGLTFVFSINCLTGRYDWGFESFAEKFHRYTFNGQPSGALGLLAASETSYSFVNDTYVWGVFDHLFPDFLPQFGTTPESRGLLPAFGNAAGKIFLKYSNWPYNVADKAVTYNLFHHHGDAFLALYSDVPQALTVIHDSVLVSGITEFEVTADSGTLIALSSGGELLGAADGTGNPVIIPIATLYPPEMLDITVTKRNHLRYHQRIHVIPPSGPYVIYQDADIDDLQGNGNGMLDYGESALLIISLTNIGNDPALGVSALVTTEDPFISIEEISIPFGDIGPGAITTGSVPVAITIFTTVPDGHFIDFTLTVEGNDTSWTSGFSFQAHAPVLEFAGMTVSDPEGNNDGRIDPGETAHITVSLKNTGSSEATGVTGRLLTSDPYLSLVEDSVYYGLVDQDSLLQQTFILSSVFYTPGGHEADLDIVFSGDSGIIGEGEFSLTIGRFPVLVIDLDPSHNSANALKQAVHDWGIGADLFQAIPEDPSSYQAIFLCLGTYPQNHILTPDEANLFIDYLNGGGMMYMEGGDTWYYDQVYYPSPLHPMFRVQGTADGNADLGAIRGKPGSFTAGMIYFYGGDNQYIDHMSPLENAFTILENINPTYATGIAYPGESYRTIGSSLEFGGLADNSSYTKKDLMGLYLNFFGFVPITVSPPIPEGPESFCVMGTPSQYSTHPIPGAEYYIWHLDPLLAGTVSGLDTAGTVNWTSGFTGTALLTVAGKNESCIGPPSDPLEISIHPLPLIYFSFETDSICAGDSAAMITTLSGQSPWTLEMNFGGIPMTMFFNKPLPDTMMVTPTADLVITVLSLVDGTGCENTSFEPVTLYVKPFPGQPAIPDGPDTVYILTDPVTSYSGYSAGADFYTWALEPPEAGTLVFNENDTTCSVSWNEGYYGQSFLSLRGENSCGAGSWSDTLAVMVGTAFGVPEGPHRIIAGIYPNPSEGSFYVFFSGEEEPFDMEVYHSNGLLVHTVRNIHSQLTKSLLLDLRDLPGGIYLVRATGRSGIDERKIILKN